MHKIYFERRCIILHSKEENPVQDRNTICIPTDDPETLYKTMLAGFEEVNAAGGLVKDEEGRHLMIMRNGLWDLPKGHQETGEDTRTCAEREVMEETGLNGIESGDLICITDHCYFRNGKWQLKHTWWYDMKCSGSISTTPQTEEGISEVVWVEKEQLPENLKNTYPSILEVFQKI